MLSMEFSQLHTQRNMIFPPRLVLLWAWLCVGRFWYWRIKVYLATGHQQLETDSSGVDNLNDAIFFLFFWTREISFLKDNIRNIFHLEIFTYARCAHHTLYSFYDWTFIEWLFVQCISSLLNTSFLRAWTSLLVFNPQHLMHWGFPINGG